MVSKLMVTTDEINKAMDMALGHIAEDFVREAIRNPEIYGCQTALQAARKCISTWGHYGQGMKIVGHRNGIQVETKNGEIEISYQQLVSRVLEGEQTSLF